MDKKKIELGIKMVLEGIGEDPNREGLRDTPRRVADMCEEIFEGLSQPPQRKVKTYTAENQDEMIMVKDIPFYSMCEHHLLPFSGRVHISYIPDNNRITGFSSLVRIVEAFAKRPQLQERMTTEIADYLRELLQPKGVLVVIEAEHMCMTMRGVKKPGSLTLTSAMRGIMRQEATRMEAFSMLRNHQR